MNCAITAAIKPFVVLVHGFSVPYYIFEPTVQFLTRHGFHVLRYDLFGRGLSDRPRAEYNIDLFIQQLVDLLDALHLARPIARSGLLKGWPYPASGGSSGQEHRIRPFR